MKNFSLGHRERLDRGNLVVAVVVEERLPWQVVSRVKVIVGVFETRLIHEVSVEMINRCLYNRQASLNIFGGADVLSKQTSKGAFPKGSEGQIKELRAGFL